MKIKVVIATYPGGGRFLEETVESFLAQGVDPVIVCDDRPTHEKWNEAIQTCDSEYLALAHHDDVYPPTFLTEMEAFLDARPNIAAAFCMDTFIDDRGSRLPGGNRLPIPEKEEYGYGDILNGMLDFGNFLRCETVVYRVDLVKALRFPSQETCGTAHDTQFWFTILDRFPIGILGRQLVRYRVHAGQDSQSQRGVGPMDHWDAIKWAAEKKPEVLRWDNRIKAAKAIAANDEQKEAKRLHEKARNAKHCEFIVCHEAPFNAGTGVLVGARVQARNLGDGERITYYVYPGPPGVGVERGCPVVRCHPTDLGRLVGEYKPAGCEFHHMLGWNMSILRDVARALPVGRTSIFLHDSWLWCLRAHSFNGTEVCNEPEPEKCARCVGATKEQVEARNREIREAIKGIPVFANSDYTAHYAALNLGVPVKVHTFAVPLLPTAFRGKRVGYFGGFAPVKGVHILLEAARLLPEIQFLLFTTVPNDWLDGRRLYGYQNVLVLGGYKREELPVLSQVIDFAVVPSINESFGLVARELRSLGLPVVCTKTGGLDGTVEPGNPQKLADAIKEAIA